MDKNYLLQYSDGTLVDGIPLSLNEARDQAMAIVQEEQRDVDICTSALHRVVVWESYDVATYG